MSSSDKVTLPTHRGGPKKYNRTKKISISYGYESKNQKNLKNLGAYNSETIKHRIMIFGMLSHSIKVYSMIEQNSRFVV